MYITQPALFFDLVIFISTCTDVLFDLRPGELKEKKRKGVLKDTRGDDDGLVLSLAYGISGLGLHVNI